MSIKTIKTKKLKRSALDGYESISAAELKERMRENDGSEAAKAVNDLTPAIELLYFVHEWRLDQAEMEE